jgi:hypothetical protein
MPPRRPPLTVAQILSWADAHFDRTGRWPSEESGPVRGRRGETWVALDRALRRGLRGLPGGTTLPRLLAERRAKRNMAALPRLTRAQILRWADAHRRRTGAWPTATSGAVTEARGETWRSVDAALRQGWRGLPGGDSLARLLDRERGGPARGRRHWTRREDGLLRRLPPAEAARRTGRTVGAVYERRRALGLTRRDKG